jgi:hypothetical protein
VIEEMSQETFDANEAAIRTGIKAIMSDPKLRKRCRIFELYESSSNELLAEVFRTAYGPVIAHQSWGNPERLRVVVVRGPQGRGQGELVVAPLTDDPDQRFPIMARNFKYRLPIRNFRQWMTEGKTKHAVSGHR